MTKKGFDLYHQHSPKATFTGKYMWICMIALATLLAAPARGQVMFSDLGSGSTVYNASGGWIVSGSSGLIGNSYVEASLFQTVAGGSVSQIDLGVGYLTGSPEFYASIYTDVGGLPGTQVGGAYWNGLTSSVTFGNCCGLVIISGISGVTLSPGTDYFMVLGPESLTDTSWNAWYWNSVGATGLGAYSFNGGSWISFGPSPTGAFEIVGPVPTPEPPSFVLCLVGILLVAIKALWPR